MPSIPVWLQTVLLLAASNVFMTFARYFHLQRKESWPLAVAIGVSWLIALPEYILQVPANRIGSSVFTLAQLKIIQEAITLVVFTVFAVVVAKHAPTWRDVIAMILNLAAVAVSLSGRRPISAVSAPATSSISEENAR